MKIARCMNPDCRLVIPGRWKKGPPKACPRCGFTGSADLAESQTPLKEWDAKLAEKNLALAARNKLIKELEIELGIARGAIELEHDNFLIAHRDNMKAGARMIELKNEAAALRAEIAEVGKSNNDLSLESAALSLLLAEAVDHLEKFAQPKGNTHLVYPECHCKKCEAREFLDRLSALRAKNENKGASQ